jgi:hypothetical protein
MLGRHARPCESFLVCIEDSEFCFSWSFCDCFCAFVLGVIPRIWVGFSPDFFEGNMDRCLVHICD